MPDDMFGVFHEESGLGHGDPFRKPLSETQLPRHSGKQFIVPGCPSGHLSDALLDKTTKLTIPGDKYTDPGSLALSLLKREGTPVSDKPFVPSRPSPKSVGAGSLYGTFGPASSILDTDASLGARSGRPLTAPEKLRNIYVNTPKQGGFGYPIQVRTVSQTQLPYMPDEYCRGRIIEREMKKAAKARFSRPFVGSARPGRVDADKWLYASLDTSDKGKAAAAAAAASATGLRPSTCSSGRAGDGRPQWRPSNPPRRGVGHGTISPIVYKASPVYEAKFHSKDEGKLLPFKPCGGRHNRLSMWTVNPYQYAAREHQPSLIL